MVLGILGLINTTLFFIAALLIFLLFYKNGYYVSNTWLFLGVQLFPILLSFLYITSLPSNYLVGKFVGGIIILLSVATGYLKEKNFKQARLFSGILIILGLIIIFL